MVLIFFLTMILMLLSVAFFTLFEVKSLGLMHLRPGPNKVSLLGILQPIGDFVKLFTKGSFYVSLSFFVYYFFSPFLGVFLSFVLWSMYFSYFSFFSFFWGVLLFFCLSSFSVYFLLFSGWSSGSFYSLLGSFRSSAQAVSYEVSMIFIFLSYIFIFYTFSFFDLFNKMGGVYFSLISFPLFFCWFLSCLAESGRSPFDFSEGESELVSGFNTEYFGGMFALIFVCEYSFIVFLCLLTSFIFGFYFYFVSVFLFCFLFVLVRACYPRLRFDLLMLFCWKIMLPLVIGIFFFFISFSIF
uniref:NADH-ubiquinone oxidoreductase chain 1 n=1 Tax=Sperchon plumifer TaxID=2047715 RepID=A0A3G1VW93_9ACAR|nr:NADH dehydrogenase subunit 1 [Sperchon plumifer]AYK28790.1 NADH dehydrogenase subunit 1 [Sperchon plumifer]